MANDESILREVDQELAEDDLQQKLRKFGPALIGAGAAIVLGVAGWQFWNAREEATAKAQALEFNDAVELLAEDQDGGRGALSAVGEAGGGYGVLARLQEAASYARGGERLRAVETYRLVYNDRSAQARVRDYARLRAAYLSLTDGRDAVLSDLGDLTESGGAFSTYAKEVSALAALGEGDYETAQSMFRELTLDLTAPAPLRTRAEDFAALAATGKAGVNISGEARVDDLIRAIGDGEIEAAEDIVDTTVEEDGASAEVPVTEEDAAENAPSDNVEAAPDEEASESAEQPTEPETEEEAN